MDADVLASVVPAAESDGSRPSGVRRIAKLTRAQVVLSIVLLFVVAVAVAAPVVAPYHPNAIDPLAIARGPSLSHLLGTDADGRDVLSRIIYGARVSLYIGIVSTAGSLLIGGVIGVVSVAAGRWADAVAMRCMDVVMAFPAILLAVVWAAVIGTGISSLLAIVIILHTPQFARVVRGSLRSEMGEPYVAAERSIGARESWIVRHHVVRNIVSPVAVFAALMVADAIALEAAMSFIGLGISPPTSSWGNIVADGEPIMLSGAWWPITFGGLAIVAAVLLFTAIAEQIDPGRPAGTVRRRSPRGRTSEPASSKEALAGYSELHRATGSEVLIVEGLAVRFPQRYGAVEVVSGVSFDIAAGETLGLVGESGCGKTLVGLSIMGLLPSAAEAQGTVNYNGVDLLHLSRRARRRLLGREIAMVYQDASSSLNPTRTVGAQVRDVCRRGGLWSPKELLDVVGLSDADRMLRSYPWELSGGQRQRVLIGLALSRGPRLVVADEPTTALDVTVQAQILDLLERLRKELKFALLLVSHDLALIRESCDRVLVLYAGRCVETGVASIITERPAHPYTEALLGSIRSLEAGEFPVREIAGSVPSPGAFAVGCRFSGRCGQELPYCVHERPAYTGEGEHWIACHNPVASTVGSLGSD